MATARRPQKIKSIWETLLQVILGAFEHVSSPATNRVVRETKITTTMAVSAVFMLVFRDRWFILFYWVRLIDLLSLDIETVSFIGRFLQPICTQKAMSVIQSYELLFNTLIIIHLC
jgi:hypothetical protein